eukprot:UC1_evm1s1675
MDTDSRRLISHLASGERLAEEIGANRHQLVDLDRRRQGNREAIGELTRKRLKD